MTWLEEPIIDWFHTPSIYLYIFSLFGMKQQQRLASPIGMGARATPSGLLMEILWRGAMITQTQEYIIAYYNRRIAYFNTFISFSLCCIIEILWLHVPPLF